MPGSMFGMVSALPRSYGTISFYSQTMPPVKDHWSYKEGPCYETS